VIYQRTSIFAIFFNKTRTLCLFFCSQASLYKLCTNSYESCYSRFMKMSEYLSCIVVNIIIKREKF